MKKIKQYKTVTLIIALILLSRFGFGQAYTPTANADVDLLGVTTAQVGNTACANIELKYVADENIKVFVWDGSDQRFAYKINNGSAVTLPFTLSPISQPDVALVYLYEGGIQYLYAVTVYNYGGNPYTDIFEYDFSNSLFYSTPVIAGDRLSTQTITNTLHVAGDTLGHFIVTWDYFNSTNRISIYPGVIDVTGSTPYVTMGSGADEFSVHGNYHGNIGMPDIAINAENFALDRTYVYLAYISNIAFGDTVNVYSSKLSSFMNTSWTVTQWSPTPFSNDHVCNIGPIVSACIPQFPNISVPMSVLDAQTTLLSTKPICAVTWQEDCTSFITGFTGITTYVTNTRDVWNTPNPVEELSDATGTISGSDDFNTLPPCVISYDASTVTAGWNYKKNSGTNMSPITKGVVATEYVIDPFYAYYPLMLGAWDYYLIEDITFVTNEVSCLSLATDGDEVLYFYYDHDDDILYYKYYSVTNPPRIASTANDISTIKVYPNPFTDVMKLLPADADANYRLTITDAGGKQLFTLEGNQQQMQTGLDKVLPAFLAGVYLFKLVDVKKGSTLQVKAIKSK